MKFSDQKIKGRDLTRKDLIIHALWSAHDLLCEEKEDEAYTAFMWALKLEGLLVTGVAK